MSSRLMKYYDLLPDNKPLCSVRERERERERMNLNFECLPPSGDPAYWAWVHENLDL